MGVPRAAQALAPRAWQPQGVGSEAYLNGTSQGPTPCGCQEGWPYPWSQQVIHEISGLCQRMVSDQPSAFRKKAQTNGHIAVQVTLFIACC